MKSVLVCDCHTDAVTVCVTLLLQIFNIQCLSTSCGGHTRAALPHAALSKHVTKICMCVVGGKGRGREIMMTLL